MPVKLMARKEQEAKFLFYFILLRAGRSSARHILVRDVLLCLEEPVVPLTIFFQLSGVKVIN